MDSFVIKGDFCWSGSMQELETAADAFLVCIDGYSEGVFNELPERYASLPLQDFSRHLILPGMVDLHIHAPQYAFRGLGMDMELLDWLQTYTFPEEAKYADPAYAEKAYSIFAQNMKYTSDFLLNYYTTFLFGLAREKR